MDELKGVIHDLLLGKAQAKEVALRMKHAFGEGYFGLRKNYSKEEVASLSEINKILAGSEDSDSQKAFLQYYYNQLGPDQVDLYGHHISQVQYPDKSRFSKMISFMISNGIPGSDLDEFENWLEEDDLKDGDGYRLVTPQKNLYGLIVVEKNDPRSWQISFFGTKHLIGEIKKVFG